jgi:hypothetical protein
MTIGSEYADDLKRELLSEMAENFFSRRRNLEERLDAFVSLREKVARQGALALARWRAFRRLLLGGAAADRFLSSLGFDPVALAALPENASVRTRIRRPLALTAKGRYRKAVLALYQRLRDELEHYNEGSFVPDPRDPRRKARIPGYDHLMAVGRSLNTEIDAVNSSQCPSDVLNFTKSLDPIRMEQEHACGGIGLGNSACGLDRELAYTPFDLDDLGVPRLPTPPPLDEIEDALASLADQLHSDAPDSANAALAALAKGEGEEEKMPPAAGRG